MKRSCHTEGLHALADRYDGFIVDQWGVLHDGRTAYPGAIEAMRRLTALGKQIVILSNSGKRAAPNEKRLASMGFTQGEAYTHLVTSGEATWQGIRERGDAFYASLGPRCLLISNDNDLSVVQGLSLELARSPGEADFVLLGGSGDGNDPARTQDWLAQALALGLPLICANPDLTRIVGDRLLPSAGALARSYEAQGGRVRYVGKPYPAIYEACRQRFAQRNATRIAAIGDSLEHDIDGGARAGLDTVFILGGIHRTHFDGAADPADVRQRLDALLAEGPAAHHMPDWTMRTLRW